MNSVLVVCISLGMRIAWLTVAALESFCSIHDPYSFQFGIYNQYILKACGCKEQALGRYRPLLEPLNRVRFRTEGLLQDTDVRFVQNSARIATKIIVCTAMDMVE